MESRRTNKRRAMAAAAAEDRLSGLPDDLLHSILRGLPLKQAARTSALSRRWARQWLHALASSAVIDLTDRDFARGQPPARAAATVSRCLTLHAEYGAPLHVFGVALGSGRDAGAFGRDVAGWVAAAVARGARDVEVDLTRRQEDPADNDHGCSAFVVELPGDLFLARNSLERLALGLRSLSLSDADVTDQAVQAMVSSCGALELLSLRRCRHLTSVRIAGEKLRVLEIVGWPCARCRSPRPRSSPSASTATSSARATPTTRTTLPSASSSVLRRPCGMRTCLTSASSTTTMTGTTSPTSTCWSASYMPTS
ncbi:hypothetical protein SEVIR_5G054901v4 [Setaria viridis]